MSQLLDELQAKALADNPHILQGYIDAKKAEIASRRADLQFESDELAQVEAELNPAPEEAAAPAEETPAEEVTDTTSESSEPQA